MRKIIILLFFSMCSAVFADPITITDDDGTLIVELVSAERSQRLKQLYESRYTYAWIVDSIELRALFRNNDNEDNNEKPDGIDEFREQIHNVPVGEYKVATISMAYSSYLLLGFVYFGHDYFFMVLFTNSWDEEFINLRYNKERYETIFRNTWDMLF